MSYNIFLDKGFRVSHTKLYKYVYQLFSTKHFRLIIIILSLAFSRGGYKGDPPKAFFFYCEYRCCYIIIIFLQWFHANLIVYINKYIYIYIIIHINDLYKCKYRVLSIFYRKMNYFQNEWKFKTKDWGYNKNLIFYENVTLRLESRPLQIVTPIITRY